MTTSADRKTVTLSIKNVPEALAERLRQRAKRNHRSLQGELLAILQSASRGDASSPLTLDDIARRGKELGLSVPAGESARLVREMRDSR